MRPHAPAPQALSFCRFKRPMHLTHSFDMQVLSSIVRRNVQDNPQMQMAMDEQIGTYINDAGTAHSLGQHSLGIAWSHGIARCDVYACRCM